VTKGHEGKSSPVTIVVMTEQLTPPGTLRAAAQVDLDAIRGNVALLCAQAGDAEVMAVVKADGYGHGMLPSAAAAVAGGATWLGVAVLEEALALREAGFGQRILSWLAAPGEAYARGVAADVDLGVSSVAALAEVAGAVAGAGGHVPARVHLKADTGLGRNGASRDDWPELVEAARKAEIDGTVRVVGIWSHFAYADAPGHPTIAAQVRHFQAAVAIAERAGIEPEVRHLANSAATLTLPNAHFDLVRPGIAVYGVSPGPEVGTAAELGLRPAMTLWARLALVKRLPAGHGVSYGHRYVTSRPTTLGLIPLGYADGIPRSATNRARMLAAGRVRPIAGTVCMDQVCVDLGDDKAAAGDEVVLFGPGDRGEPTAQDWAEELDTIAYEIVTRIGPRVPRVYPGEHL
jgi:alanine racemase